MQLIYRVSAVLCLCIVLGYLQAEEVFSHKDWSVTTYPADPQYIKYSTHGSKVWGHEFGFLKAVGDCKADNLYVTWSSTTPINVLEQMKSKKVLFDVKPDDNFVFHFPVPNLMVKYLSGSEYLEIPDPLSVMLFTNYFPQFTFIPTLEAGRNIIVKVNEEDPHFKNFDIADDKFSLEGYIAARQFALEQCEQRTQTLKVIYQFKTAER